MSKKTYPPIESESDSVKEPAPAVPTVFNPSQIALLRMFARDQSEEMAYEIKQVLTKHFRDKADKALEALWDSGELNQEQLDRLRSMHIRDILSD